MNIAKTDILIAGGGPAGLGAAIEAKMANRNVMVLEKRDEYSRPQWIFLTDETRSLLAKWGVDIEGAIVIEFPDNSSFTLLPISELEEKMASRVAQLGISIVRGEFVGITEDVKSAKVSFGGKEREITYQILVGADGAHSKVRDAAGISLAVLGKAYGASLLMAGDGSSPAEISDPIQQGAVWLRRISSGAGSIVLMQKGSQASQEDLRQALETQGWTKEKEALQGEDALVLANVPIALAQADTFASKTQDVILVGDAAASASFFQGLGANTALKTAEVAGRFFQGGSLDAFNNCMKETTDEMIRSSQFLFPDFEERDGKFSSCESEKSQSDS